MLRIQEETLQDKLITLPESYGNYTAYGYLIRSFTFQENPSPFIVYFRTVSFGENISFLDKNIPTIVFLPTKIGDVRHSRFDLRRITGIDVIAFGESQSEVSQERRIPQPYLGNIMMT